MILLLPLVAATIAFSAPLPGGAGGPPPPDVVLREPFVAWPHAVLDAPPRREPRATARGKAP